MCYSSESMGQRDNCVVSWCKVRFIRLWKRNKAYYSRNNDNPPISKLVEKYWAKIIHGHVLIISAGYYFIKKDQWIQLL